MGKKETKSQGRTVRVKLIIKQINPPPDFTHEERKQLPSVSLSYQTLRDDVHSPLIQLDVFVRRREGSGSEEG